MRRRISLLLAAMLAGTTLMLLSPAQPASAWVVCAGAGTATVTPGLLYPVLLSVMDPGLDHTVDILIFNQTNLVHGFTFGFLTPCVHTGIPPTLETPVATGILKGYCGHSSGVGTLGGQQFTYVSAGTLLILTGHVIGVANAIPVPVITGSCLHAAGMGTTTFPLPGGATLFAVSGAGGGFNCTNALPPIIDQLIVLPEPTLVLPTQTAGVHVGPHVTHIWASAPCTAPGSPVL